MLWDLLDEHAQALAAGDREKQAQVRALAQDLPEALALMDVAEHVHRAYQPVLPSPKFRKRLGKELRRAVRRRLWWREKVPRAVRSYWLWGAVASLLSVAGGVGYYLVRRSQAA